MLRAVQLSLAGITLLGAASVGVLALASTAESQPATPAVAPAPSEAPATPPVAAPPRIAFAARAAPVAAAVAPQPERDAFAKWSSDVAFCFRDLVDGGRGSRATDLMLYLQTREDAVDVVEAKVARPGALPPSVVECAREVLRGVEVKVFFATPGQRFSYLYEIEA
jgi:hypothetical protein